MQKIENREEALAFIHYIFSRNQFGSESTFDYLKREFDYLGNVSDIDPYQFLDDSNVIDSILKNINYKLEYIPNWLLSKKICRIAIEKRGEELQFVPSEYKTKTLCKLALNNSETGGVLEFVPDRLLTKEICQMAIEKFGEALQYVPKNLITQEFCLIAVKNSKYGSVLKFIPDSLKTKGICQMAIEKAGENLQYVPENLITQEFCLIAINNSKSEGILKFIPYSIRTKEMCILALEKNIKNLLYIPETDWGFEIKKSCVQKDGMLLPYAVPDRNKRKYSGIRDKFLSDFYFNYLFIDNENGRDTMQRNNEINICITAVQQNENAKEYVPNKYKREVMEIIYKN